MKRIGIINIYGLNSEMLESFCPDIIDRFKTNYKYIKIAKSKYSTYHSLNASLITGCKSDIHNVYDNYYINKYYEQEQYLSSFIKKNPIWWVLSLKSVSSFIIQVPFAYPVQNINGNLLSDYIYVKNKSFVLHNDSDIIELNDNYITLHQYANQIDFNNVDTNEFIKITEKYFESINLLLEKPIEYQFYLLNIDLLFYVEQSYCRYNDYSQKSVDNYYKLIRNIYHLLNKYIPRLLDLFQQKTNHTFFISPRPVSIAKTIISTNMLLQQKKFYNTKYKGKSTVFSDNTLGYIYANKKSIFLKGNLNKSKKYADKCQTIKNYLNSNIQTDSIKEYIFNNSFECNSPDIIPVIEKLDYINVCQDIEGPINFKNDFPDNNYNDGFLYVKSDIVNYDSNINSISIEDCYPAIIYMFNKRIPRDIDGVLTRKLFKQKILQKNIPLYETQDPMKIVFQEGNKKYSKDEIHFVHNRIKKMGYGE